MDVNESEVAESVLRNLGMMSQAVSDLSTKVGKFQVEGLVSNVKNVGSVVSRSAQQSVCDAG